VLKTLLIDRAAVYGILAKVTQAVAGLLSALLVLKYFSPAVQGFYYTFANVLALQIFVELGLSAVITTFAAHEWAKLSLDRETGVGGDERALARLRSLTRKVVTWYAVGGALLLVALPVVGLWFFATRSDGDAVAWKYPWIAMCVLTAASFTLTPAWALLTGCGQLGTLNGFRLIDTVIRYGALWVCIVHGASLWSAAAASATSLVLACGFLVFRYRLFFGALLRGGENGQFDWMKELAPLQMRIALSWISGYFAFSLFAPSMFYFHGPEAAGGMGMTWAFIGGLSGIAATWLQVQAPKLAVMVANGEYRALDTVSRRLALIGIGVFSAGSVVGLGALLIVGAYRPDLAARLIGLGPILAFLCAELLQQVSMVQSTYLRAFKREPFLGISVTTGGIIGAGTLLLTREFGAYGPAFSYLAGVVVALVWGTYTFVRCRRQWTAPAQS
jgi:hypothetical protein